jgi:hypothetical protein
MTAAAPSHTIVNLRAIPMARALRKIRSARVNQRDAVKERANPSQTPHESDMTIDDDGP